MSGLRCLRVWPLLTPRQGNREGLSNPCHHEKTWISPPRSMPPCRSGRSSPRTPRLHRSPTTTTTTSTCPKNMVTAAQRRRGTVQQQQQPQEGSGVPMLRSGLLGRPPGSALLCDAGVHRRPDGSCVSLGSVVAVVTAGARWARSPRRGERCPLLVRRASDPWTIALRWRRRRTSCARKS
jgi:hypothetical protein